jgi:ElaB/YqjD/DUF883 family membrane-anchored ribosome-binding protein
MEKKNGNGRLEQLQDAAEERIGQARQKAREHIDKAEKAVEESRKKAAEYVKRNPEKSVAIAAGIGAAVGAFLAMLGRRRR